MRQLISTSPEMAANRLWEKMIVNFTITQCVNLCLQDPTQSTIVMQIGKDSSPVVTNVEEWKIWSCLTSTKWDRLVQMGNSTQQEFRKKDWLNADGFCRNWKAVFEAMGCFHHYCFRHQAWPALTEEYIRREIEKREMDEMRKHYTEKKFTLFLKCGNLNDGNPTRRCLVREHLREFFPYNRPSCQDQHLDKKNQANFLTVYSLKSKLLNNWKNNLLNSADFEKHKRMQIINWNMNARVCWEGNINVPTAMKVIY